MNPNKALWEKGDFTEIAAFMRQSEEVLVKSCSRGSPNISMPQAALRAAADAER